MSPQAPCPVDDAGKACLAATVPVRAGPATYAMSTAPRTPQRHLTPPTHRKEPVYPMTQSQARRMANQLDEATEIVKSAASAAAQHRYRGTGGTWPGHIADLFDLTTAAETLHYMLTQHLTGIAKACAHDVRAHYFHDPDPNGHTWPQDVKQAAAEADRALSWLRRYLEKAPVAGCHNALKVLHASVQNTHRTQAAAK